jgi:exoribonuclease-2
MDLENRIVDYFGSNELKLGIVSREAKQKLQVQTETGRAERVNVKQLLAVHGSVGSGAAAEALEEVRSQIAAAQEDVDGELLWQELLEREEALPLEDVADAVHVSAVARCLADDPVHFRRRGVEFTARTPEEAAEVELLRARRAEKAAERERALSWVKSLLGKRGEGAVPVPDDLEDFVRKTEDYLLVGHNSDAVNTLSEAHAKKHARDVALIVLSRTGRLPEDADPFLLANGIHAGFSNAVHQYADSLRPYCGGGPRADYTGLPAVSIDDAETLEVDDAVSVQRLDGIVTVGIHIADPAYFVDKDDALDRVATERPLSLYLPTTTVTMFPERLACDLASLKAEQLRPSLSFVVRFDEEGGLLDWEFGSAQVSVSRRLDYHDADRLIQEGEGEHGEQLRDLVRITDALRKKREEAGAFNLHRPEIKVRVRDDQVTVERIDSGSPSHLIVSELMILANRLTAEYALRHDIPIIYRVQDPPGEPVAPADGYDPVHFEQQVRKMKRTRLSTHPQPHAGLGLELYTQVSSPLRRYADLVLQRQLDAHFQGKEFPYQQQELFEVLGNVERTAYQNRNLEREAARHWILEFLRRERMDIPVEATVVSRNGNRVFAELHEVCERGLLFTNANVRVGECVEVRIKDVQPAEGRLALTM